MATLWSIIQALLVIALVVAVILGSFWLLGELNDFYDGETESDKEMIVKILLFLPWMVVLVWCILLSVALSVFALLGFVNIANDLKRWVRRVD
jgi:hypothetical protein